MQCFVAVLRQIAALLLCAAVLAGCAQVPLRSGPLTECRALYAAVDRKTDVSGAADPGLYRVPGFPYLRSSRLLASFRDEVKDDRRFDAWITALRQADSAARDREILVANGRTQWDEKLLDLRQRLQHCGDQLAQADLTTPAARARLRDAVRVPSDYSFVQRLFGAYPLTMPFLKIGVDRYQAQAREDFAQPLQSPASAQMTLWQAVADPGIVPATPDEVAGWIAAGAQSPLGLPRFSPQQLQRMFVAYAPQWWVETQSDDDRLGHPVFDAHDQPTLDTGSAVTYVLQDDARIDGRVLPQLVYIVWFAARPATSALDAYAGHLDGLVWRVTLGSDGRPLVYDTIHPCGCYHEYFTARPLKRRGDQGFWSESALIPQGAPVGVTPVAVRIAAGTHFVQRVLPQREVPQAQGQSGHYRMLPYVALLQLPDVAGKPRSLFDAGTGLIAGTERAERWWLWISGVRSPGAMRAWGRHAIKFVGEGQFDDPYLLDHVFDFSAIAP
ncbi:MAG: hypothetical protein ACRESS_08850 [Stenotrophobium sp.]